MQGLYLESVLGIYSLNIGFTREKLLWINLLVIIPISKIYTCS